MTAKSRRISGWILTGLIGLFMIGASGVPKFVDWQGRDAMMAHLGIATSLLPALGAIEITVTLLYLVPRTSFLGAILVSAYLGGAVMTHLRIGEPWWFPIIIGVLAWLGLALRQPAIIQMALGRTVATGQPATERP